MQRKAAITFALVLLVSCASNPTLEDTPQARPGFPVYRGDVVIEPGSKSLNASWQISFVPDSTTADSVALLLNRGLRVATLAGPGVAAFTQSESEGWNRITVRFAPEVQPGSPVRFGVAYAGIPVFSEDSINNVKPNWIELGLDGAWHPVFAAYDQYITGGFRLRTPTPWQVIASGTTTRTSEGVQVNNTIPLIDLAFVAAPAFAEARSTAATVYHVHADTAVVRRVLDTTGSCAAHLNERYGARERLPHVKIVLAPRSGPGYARTNYIVITEVAKLPAEALRRFLCHELAHFWSSRAIASAPENRLNDAIAPLLQKCASS